MTAGDARPLAGRVRLEATVRGRVQGVGFRWFAVHAAEALGLVGTVANAADGGVEVVAEGTRTDLEAFAGRLREGPPASRVDAIELRWAPARGVAAGFRIVAGAHRGD